MPQPAILLFDLGGVLVDNAHLEDLPNIISSPLAAGDVQNLWLSSPAVRRFESGQIGAEEFASLFVSEWGSPLAPAAFLERFAAWPKGFFPGAGALLTQLRRTYKVAYLSNSNEVHWRGFSDILRHADVAFASHLCGLVKPDPAIFSFVINALGREPAEICFFDDAIRNVEAARAAGINAHLTKGFKELTDTLSALGIASPSSVSFDNGVVHASD